MSESPFSKCPKCGDTGMELPIFLRADLDDTLTCQNCWHKALKSVFTDAARPDGKTYDRRKLARRRTDAFNPGSKE